MCCRCCCRSYVHRNDTEYDSWLTPQAAPLLIYFHMKAPADVRLSCCLHVRLSHVDTWLSAVHGVMQMMAFWNRLVFALMVNSSGNPDFRLHRGHSQMLSQQHCSSAANSTG